MSTIENNVQQYLYKLCLILLIFVGTGLALSFSISYSYSILQGRNIGTFNGATMYRLFFKQLIATIIGLGGILYLLKSPTTFLRKSSNFIAIIAVIAMIYTSFFGPEINGARRWIIIGGISLQTGDFARLALILYLSNVFAQYHKALFKKREDEQERYISRQLLIRFFIAIFIYGGTLYIQKDYSSLMIGVTVILSIALVSDMPTSWKIRGIIASFVLFLSIVLTTPNRLERIMNFFYPNLDPLGLGFQIRKSYELIGSAGWLGDGVGSNMLDVLSLPYFNNDFVFSIIVGEYGLIGAFCILSLFWLMCWYTFKLGRRLYIVDRYYYYLMLASVVNLIISAVAHISVTLGVIPTAGLNLPFYSSGGSSMITSLLSYGFILRSALALYTYEKKKNTPPPPTQTNTTFAVSINTPSHLSNQSMRGMYEQ